jgi:hypothetical protein
MTITDKELAELEELHRAATPGSWRVKKRRDEEGTCWAHIAGPPGQGMITAETYIGGEIWGPEALATMHLIVATRNALPGLVARIRELEEMVMEDNAVCVCGCPPEAHEDYGEDGESCENDSHGCLRTSEAAASMLEEMREEIARLQKKATEAATLVRKAKGDNDVFDGELEAIAQAIEAKS